MQYNSSTTYPYSGSSSTALNKAIKDINDSIDEIELQLSSLNSALNTKESAAQHAEDIQGLSNRISSAQTEINNFANSITTQNLTATNVNVSDTTTSRTVKADKYDWKDAVTIDVSEPLIVPEKDSVLFFEDGDKSAIVNFADINNFTVVSNTEDFIKYNDRGIYAGVGGLIRVVGNYTTEAIANLNSLVATKEGTTVVGDFYAVLGEDYTFDNLEVRTNLNAEHAYIKSLEADTEDVTDSRITRLNVTESETVAESNITSLTTSRLNTKIASTPISIGDHGVNDPYVIEVPVTNGNWQIELNEAGTVYFKVNIQKVKEASVVEYSRLDEDALPKIELYNGKLYLFTIRRGDVYFAYQAFDENNTATIETYSFANRQPYAEPDVSYDVIKDDNTVIFGSLSVAGDLDVSGSFTMEDYAADKVVVREIDDEDLYNLTLTKPYPEIASDNYVYADTDLKYDTETDTLLANNISATDITATDTVSADKLLGASLEVSETETVVDPDTEEETTVIHKYVEADNTGLTVNVDTTINNVVTIGELE